MLKTSTSVGKRCEGEESAMNASLTENGQAPSLENYCCWCGAWRELHSRIPWVCIECGDRYEGSTAA